MCGLSIEFKEIDINKNGQKTIGIFVKSLVKEKLLYKFFESRNGTWKVIKNFTSDTFINWKPKERGKYIIMVQAKRVNSKNPFDYVERIEYINNEKNPEIKNVDENSNNKNISIQEIQKANLAKFEERIKSKFQYEYLNPYEEFFEKKFSQSKNNNSLEKEKIVFRKDDDLRTNTEKIKVNNNEDTIENNILEEDTIVENIPEEHDIEEDISEGHGMADIAEDMSEEDDKVDNIMEENNIVEDIREEDDVLDIMEDISEEDEILDIMEDTSEEDDMVDIIEDTSEEDGMINVLEDVTRNKHIVEVIEDTLEEEMEIDEGEIEEEIQVEQEISEEELIKYVLIAPRKNYYIGSQIIFTLISKNSENIVNKYKLFINDVLVEELPYKEDNTFVFRVRYCGDYRMEFYAKYKDSNKEYLQKKVQSFYVRETEVIEGIGINCDKTVIKCNEDVTFMTTVKGGQNVIYEFYIFKDNKWTLVQGYSKKSYYTLMPFKEGSYRLLVLAKNYDSKEDYDEFIICKFDVQKNDSNV